MQAVEVKLRVILEKAKLSVFIFNLTYSVIKTIILMTPKLHFSSKQVIAIIRIIIDFLIRYN